MRMRDIFPPKNNSGKYIIIPAAIAAGILLAFAANSFSLNYGGGGATGAYETPAKPSYAFTEDLPPARILIPSLGINANVQKVGLASNGSMDVAHSYSDVGWYEYGTYPGAPGNAVIEGHLDTKISPYAVFYNLKLLKPGDEVDVIDTAGRRSVFEVTGDESIPYDAQTSEIFAPAQNSYLNLVTCDGDWIPEKKMYTERLIVFTKRLL